MKRQLFRLLCTFQERGVFSFAPGERLSRCSASVLNKPGVYIIYAYFRDGAICHVYHGKAGMLRDGRHCRQGVKGRVNNVGNRDRRREVIFTDYLLQRDVTHLKIHWFITWNEQQQVNPCVLEDALYEICPVEDALRLN